MTKLDEKGLFVGIEFRLFFMYEEIFVLLFGGSMPV